MHNYKTRKRRKTLNQKGMIYYEKINSRTTEKTHPQDE